MIEKLPEQPVQAPWWQPGLVLFYKLSGLVAIPILLAIFIGKGLDKYFATDPWIFLSLTAIALISSTFAIIIVYAKEIKKIEDEDVRLKAQKEVVQNKSVADKGYDGQGK